MQQQTTSKEEIIALEEEIQHYLDRMRRNELKVFTRLHDLWQMKWASNESYTLARFEKYVFKRFSISERNTRRLLDAAKIYEIIRDSQEYDNNITAAAHAEGFKALKLEITPEDRAHGIIRKYNEDGVLAVWDAFDHAQGFNKKHIQAAVDDYFRERLVEQPPVETRKRKRKDRELGKNYIKLQFQYFVDKFDDKDDYEEFVKFVDNLVSRSDESLKKEMNEVLEEAKKKAN